MNQDDYDYAQEQRNDNLKRIGSAVFTVVIIIIYIALQADDCSDDSSYGSYDYTPSFSYSSPTVPSYEGLLDRTQKTLEEMQANDAVWKLAIETTDPFAIAANAKHAPCDALASVMDQTPTWTAQGSEYALVDAKTAVKSPYPIYVIHEDETLPGLSPEGIVRGEMLIEKAIGGSEITAPKLMMKDLLLQTGVMPKPAKRAKKVKGAIAPGTKIVRGWIFDHREERVVCAGVAAIPDELQDGLLTDTQLETLIKTVPGALRTVPQEAIMVEEAPKKKKTR